MSDKIKIEPGNLYCIDCLEGMRAMEDNSVNISITSPPYNIKHLIRYDKKNNKYYHQKVYEKYKDDVDNYGQFISELVGEMIRVSKHYVFFNIQMLLGNKLDIINLLTKYKNNLKDVIIWNKTNVQPAINKTQLSSQFEFIFVFAKEEYCNSKPFEYAFFNNREKGQLNTNVITGKNASREANDCRNFAVFPEYIPKWILEKFTKEGDVVLDPCSGSGTTAVVCKKYKRIPICFDIDQTYIDYAKKRLRNTEVYNNKWW